MSPHTKLQTDRVWDRLNKIFKVTEELARKGQEEKKAGKAEDKLMYA